MVTSLPLSTPHCFLQPSSIITCSLIFIALHKSATTDQFCIFKSLLCCHFYPRSFYWVSAEHGWSVVINSHCVYIIFCFIVVIFVYASGVSFNITPSIVFVWLLNSVFLTLDDYVVDVHILTVFQSVNLQACRFNVFLIWVNVWFIIRSSCFLFCIIV